MLSRGPTPAALAAGTPALIIPSYSEQVSNARRAATLGAALHLVREATGADTHRKPEPALVPAMGGVDKRLEPKLVAGSIGRLLEDPRYSDSARAAGQQLAGLPGAADIIETPPAAG